MSTRIGQRLRCIPSLGLILVATGAVGSCSNVEPSRGGLMLVMSQDGSLPIGLVEVSVTSNDVLLLSQGYKVPQEVQLPTTIALVSNGDPTAAATISITAWQVIANQPNVALDRRDAIVTQIPVDRVAELKVVLTARCSKWVDGSGQPACQPRGYTCDGATGTCVPPNVVATDLETYQGGSESGGAGGLTGASGSEAGSGGSNDAGGTQDDAGTSGEGGSPEISQAGSAGASDFNSQACSIGRAMFESGQQNPANRCLVCDPNASTSEWTKAADGTDCDSGKVCNSGVCVAGCFVERAFYGSGVGQPGNAICQSCDPTSSTSSWTPQLSGLGCGLAQICSFGICKSGCFVDGAYLNPGKGQPGNLICETCQPATSTSTWTAASEGTDCGSNQICHSGKCQTGCFIAGKFYEEGAVNGCQTCQPEKSRSAWTNADGMACAGGTCCSNTCVNQQTSNTHCGGCDLACPTGCTAGECVVRQCPFIGSPDYYGIGLDAKNAYITHTGATGASLTWFSLDGNCTRGADSSNGAWQAVLSISVTSSGVAYSVVGPPYPTNEMHYIVPGKGNTVKVGPMKAPQVPITSDATNVYWLDFASGVGNVVRAPISGVGPVTPLASIGAAGAITIDATYVYWADTSSINRVPIAGGTVTTLVSNLSVPGFVAVDSSNLYYTCCSGALYRLPLGSTTSTLLMGSQGTMTDRAIGPKTFYWSNGTKISSVSLTGGAVGTASASPIKILYTVPSDQSVNTLGVLGNSLYWIDRQNNNLMKLSPN